MSAVGLSGPELFNKTSNSGFCEKSIYETPFEIFKKLLSEYLYKQRKILLWMKRSLHTKSRSLLRVLFGRQTGRAFGWRQQKSRSRDRATRGDLPGWMDGWSTSSRSVFFLAAKATKATDQPADYDRRYLIFRMPPYATTSKYRFAQNVGNVIIMGEWKFSIFKIGSGSQ